LKAKDAIVSLRRWQRTAAASESSFIGPALVKPGPAGDRDVQRHAGLGQSRAHPRGRQRGMPAFDQAFAGLITDLDQRGLWIPRW
jgi:hypothetical protein